MTASSFTIDTTEYAKTANYVFSKTAFDSILNKQVNVIFDHRCIGNAVIVDVQDGKILASVSMTQDTSSTLAVTNKLEKFNLHPRCAGKHEVVNGAVQLKIENVTAFELVPQISAPAHMVSKVLALQVRDFFNALLNISTVRGIGGVIPEDDYRNNEIILHHLAKEPSIKQAMSSKEEGAWESLLERLERTALPSLSSITPALSEAGVGLLHLYLTKRLLNGIPPIELPMNRYGFESKNRDILTSIDNQINLIISQLTI